MQTYTCLLTDSRYTVPTLSFLFTSDVERARALARRELQASAYHRRFELHDGERVVCVEDR
jgi:hypothetical protein